MAFQNFKNSNNARTKLKYGILAGDTSLTVDIGEGALFETSNFLLTLTKFNTSGLFTKKEVVKCTNRVGDVFAIIRAFEVCVQDETASPKVQSQNPLSFDAGDFVELMLTSGDLKDMKDEIERLETDKANDDEVVKLTGNQTIGGIKTLSSSPIIPTAPINDNSTKGATTEYVDRAITISSLQKKLGNNDHRAGENLITNDSLYVEDLYENITGSNIQNISDINANKRVAFRYLGSGIEDNQIQIPLNKEGTPSADLSIRIETDSSGPTGSLFDANAIATFSSGNAKAYLNPDGFTLGTSGAAETVLLGYRFTTSSDLIVNKVNKNATSTATKAYLYTEEVVGTPILLETATFSGNIATFTNNHIFTTGQYFRVLCGSDGSSYTSRFNNAVSYPYNSVSVVYEKGASYNTATTTHGLSTNTAYNIDSIEVINMETVNLTGNITIPKGQAVWLIMNQGTYGSETVNNTNYYKTFINTKTSAPIYISLFDTSYTNNTTKIGFTKSDLFAEEFLLKTDANFSYALPTIKIQPPRISISNYTTGQTASYIFDGIVDTFSGLSKGSIYYASDTPGALSLVAGTISRKIGVALSENQLMIDKLLGI